MTNRCAHGTFLHVSLQRSHLNHCYYHQDLHNVFVHKISRLSFTQWGLTNRTLNTLALLHVGVSTNHIRDLTLNGLTLVLRFSAIHFQG